MGSDARTQKGRGSRKASAGAASVASPRQDPSIRWSEWLLTPEGAAVHPEERTAVIADVHLGYEWARGQGGDCVPEHSLKDTIAKLSTLFDRQPIEQLIVAGDLVESPSPCVRTEQDVRRLKTWLNDRGIRLIPLAGNHDPARGAGLPPTFEVAGWTIGHGHQPIDAPKTMSGHVHPVLRAAGLTAPCFLAGPTRIVLPAFSPNAAGWNIVTATLPAAWRTDGLRCIAGMGTELLDFGPVSSLGLTLSSL